MALQDLAYTVLYVDDVEREAEFYRQVLGLTVAYSAPGWVQFRTEGAALVLHPRLESQKNAARGACAHAAFRVDDLAAEYERLSARGVTFHAPPASAGFGKHVTLVDPEGNEIDLLEWAARPEAPVSAGTVTNEIVNRYPETMEVFEEHGIRICGGCLVLLNAPVQETADYSGLDARETSELVEELNEKIAELRRPETAPAGAA